MTAALSPDLPIHLQLRARVIALILEARVKEGDALPSVRALAAAYRLHPLTVLKVYQQLVEENVLESRARLGMFVTAGARARLLAEERAHFIEQEWPSIVARIDRLEFSLEQLLAERAPEPGKKRQAR